jgi:hypothetical protein
MEPGLFSLQQIQNEKHETFSERCAIHDAASGKQKH